ncbi:hypothetical protein [Stenotrophomonas ginsengisoli]|uniref:hypothetical protein n=1 Tax=Stenotrophomonas ginsengisoli TaxID=336566 RepID=UPI00128EEF58|nr:hypothetical protein [Stenotrophomonas ginsengisoli]
MLHAQGQLQRLPRLHRALCGNQLGLHLRQYRARQQYRKQQQRAHRHTAECINVQTHLQPS